MSDNLTKLKKIGIAGLVIFVGLLIFKYLPMRIWGKDILFDASAHIATAIFVLYILWFFVDQNKTWRIPYLIFAFLVLAIISLQRIITFAHNDVGLLLGLILGIVAIAISQWRRIKGKLDF